MSPLVAQTLPSVNTSVPLYLTAHVSASQSHYAIQYWETSVPLAINQAFSTAAGSPNTEVLSLSGQAYRTHGLAVDALPASLGAWYRVPTGPSRQVELISGFDASYYPNNQVLTWHEGDWTIDVSQGSLANDLSEGHEIVRVLDQWALPPFPGILTAAPAQSVPSSPAPRGDVYNLAFADGQAVYQISPFYNDGVRAVDALKAPDGLFSPLDLVRAANSLVPTTSFYNPGVSQIRASATPATIYAGMDALISGQLLNQYGQAVAHSAFSLTGLPLAPHYLNGVTSSMGKFSVPVLFPRAGIYIIGAGHGLVGQDLTIDVKPAPVTLPSIVQNALSTIASRTTVPVSGPTLLPTPTRGYVTAVAQAVPSTYVVFLINTKKPLSVNSPLINSNLEPHPNMAQFSTARLTAVQPPPGSPHYLQYLARYNSLFATHLGRASRTVDLSSTVQASWYSSSKTQALEWNEGDWTIQVQGSSLAQAIHTASPLVTYFNHYLLPPYPGIVTVRLDGRSPNATTQIDWMNGHLLSIISDSSASALNPFNAVAMATHWTTLGSE